MWNRNIVILLAAQMIAVTGSVLIVTVGGLIGSALSANPAFATLPLSVLVLGTAAATVFAAMLMRRIGRRCGCAIAAASLLAGTLIHAWGWDTVLWSIAPLLLLVSVALILLPRAAGEPSPAAR